MSGRLLAVVGTDTGVGKTVIGAGLLRGLRRAGLRVAAFKPVETGLAQDPATTVGGEVADWVRLAQAAEQPPKETLGVSFPLPAAPLAAARAAGLRLDVGGLEARLAELRIQNELVLLEGAGGLCVPFAEGLLWVDLLARWRPDCLVVGRLGLGTVNHTLLTVGALTQRGLLVSSIILNTLAPPSEEASQTPGLISEFAKVNVGLVVPHGATDPTVVADLLEEAGLIARITSRCRTD